MKHERQNDLKQRQNPETEPTGNRRRSRFSAFRFPLSAFPFIALALTVSASSNPYNGIVDRNVFSLKPIPKADDTPKGPPAPPVKLTLTGITTILGNKRALLKAQIPPRPPEPPKEESYMLTEGQRDSGVEVISIDERAGVVKVINNGISETLDFINNGAKSVASAPAPNIPGVIPPGGIPAPTPSGNNNSINPLTRQIPSQYGGTVQNGTGADADGVAGGNLANANTSPATMHFQGSVTPEVQAVMIKAQQLNLMDKGDSEGAAMFPNVDLPDEAAQ